MGISLQCCRNLAIAETEIRLSSPMELSKGRRAQEMKKAFFLLAGLLLYLSRESALKSLLLQYTEEWGRLSHLRRTRQEALWMRNRELFLGSDIFFLGR